MPGSGVRFFRRHVWSDCVKLEALKVEDGGKKVSVETFAFFGAETVFAILLENEKKIINRAKNVSSKSKNYRLGPENWLNLLV